MDCNGDNFFGGSRLCYATILLILSTVAVGSAAGTSLGRNVRGVGTGPSVDLATQRLVLATYLNNWEAGGGWDGWSYHACGVRHYPGTIYPNGTRDVASVYYPLIGAYDAGDEAVMEYHIRLAQASGIDVFVVDWDGVQGFGDFPRINTNFLKLLRVAEKMGFSLAIDYDAGRYYVGRYTVPGSGLIPDRARALQAIHDDLVYAIKRFGSSSAYLRFGGKPVIFSFADFALKPSEWSTILGALANEGLSAYYVSMNAVLKSYPPFQGFFPWIDANAIIRHETDSVSFINDWADQFRSFSMYHQITWGLAVWPGFDDSPVNGWCGGSRVIGRNNGLLYNQTWTAAIRNGPQWVHVVTFNDWNEGTIVEPSLEFGYQYLYATAYFAARFKSQQPSYDAIPVPLAIYNATLAIRAAESQGRAVGLDDARAKLDQAKNSFDSKEYSESLTLAKQALELANKATVPLTSSTRITTVTSSSSNVIQTSLLKYEWYLLPAAVLVVGVIFMIVRRVRRTVKH